jgi:hypothetical protein
LRAFTPAWLIPLDPAVVGLIPTLVVTSGARDSYDEVAQVSGGHRLVLPGYGHRVQDHPDATTHFQAFWASGPE